MIRAYAVGLGASTQTLLGLAWIVLLQQEPTGLTRDLMMTAAWVINILIAERVIQLHQRGIRHRPKRLTNYSVIDSAIMLYNTRFTTRRDA